MDDDTLSITDDDRQTPSSGRNVSDDISTVITENLSVVVYENDQQRIPSSSNTYVHPLTINNRKSLPNINIEQSTENDNVEKRIIIDEHVKVSRVNRANLRSLNTCSRRKSTSNVCVSRLNNTQSQTINSQETSQITFKQDPISVNNTRIVSNINQKITATKPRIIQVVFSNELPCKLCQKQLHVNVDRTTVNKQKSS